MTIETDPWADHVLHEEGGLAHHRSPAGLVPADRAVIEGDVQVAVICSRHLVRELAPMACTVTGLAPVIWHMTST